MRFTARQGEAMRALPRADPRGRRVGGRREIEQLGAAAFIRRGPLFGQSDAVFRGKLTGIQGRNAVQ